MRSYDVSRCVFCHRYEMNLALCCALRKSPSSCALDEENDINYPSMVIQSHSVFPLLRQIHNTNIGAFWSKEDDDNSSNSLFDGEKMEGTVQGTDIHCLHQYFRHTPSNTALSQHSCLKCSAALGVVSLSKPGRSC